MSLLKIFHAVRSHIFHCLPTQCPNHCVQWQKNVPGPVKEIKQMILLLLSTHIRSACVFSVQAVRAGVLSNVCDFVLNMSTTILLSFLGIFNMTKNRWQTVQVCKHFFDLRTKKQTHCSDEHCQLHCHQVEMKVHLHAVSLRKAVTQRESQVGRKSVRQTGRAGRERVCVP